MDATDERHGELSSKSKHLLTKVLAEVNADAVDAEAEPTAATDVPVEEGGDNGRMSEDITELFLAKFTELAPCSTERRRVVQRERTVRRKKLRGKPMERRRKYRDVQREWLASRKRCTRRILDGTCGEKCQIDPEVVQTTYMDRFGAASKKVTLNNYAGVYTGRFPNPDVQQEAPGVGADGDSTEDDDSIRSANGCNVEGLMTPITAAEVRRSLRSMPSDSAAGPDGLRVKTLKDQSKSEDYPVLAGLFNVWFITGRLPSKLKQSRSILLPKCSSGLDEIGNWRPLSIASTLARLYTKILAKRLSESVTLHPAQRGFIRAAGVSENTILLEHLIRKAKGQGKGSLVVAFLDLAKAFDTVSHCLSERGLERLGVPKKFTEVVRDLYTGASTVFGTGGGDTRPIPINQGVKQGDPLSPILFNVALDPLFCTLQQRGRGWSEGGRDVAALGYADDTALISDSRAGMETNLEIVESFCRDVELRLNVRKSYIFQIDMSAKSWHVNHSREYVVDGDAIPWISPDESVRYLGKAFGPWCGMSVPSVKVQLANWAACLKGSGLKPLQKLEIWRSEIIPRVKARVIGSRTSQLRLKELDTIIRGYVKLTLHLHPTVNDSFLYAPTRSGGLGIGELSSIVPFEFKRAIARMGGFRDIKQARSPYVRWWSHTLGVRETYEKQPDIEMRHRQHATAWSEKLTQGIGASTWVNERDCNYWLRNGPYSQREFITALELRTNTYPTRACLARTGHQGPTMCRRCGRTVETLGHISGACAFVRRMRIRRHNSICTIVQNKMLGKGWTVLWEQPYTVGGVRLVPDLVCFSPDGDKVVVVDPTVVWETTADQMGLACRQKVTKYEPLRECFPGKEFVVTGLVIGARGGWVTCNDDAITALGMQRPGCKRAFIRACTVRALGGTIAMVNSFMNE